MKKLIQGKKTIPREREKERKREREYDLKIVVKFLVEERNENREIEKISASELNSIHDFFFVCTGHYVHTLHSFIQLLLSF